MNFLTGSPTSNLQPKSKDPKIYDNSPSIKPMKLHAVGSIGSMNFQTKLSLWDDRGLHDGLGLWDDRGLHDGLSLGDGLSLWDGLSL